MLFPTIDFAVFFVVVLTGSWLLMPRRGEWKFFVLVASYVFYGWWNPRFCLLLAGVTLVNHFGGTAVSRLPVGRARSLVLALTVVADLGVGGGVPDQELVAQQEIDEQQIVGANGEA